ncbi:MAG TPA: tRNA pseudouridine(55) synthase TruB [Oscillospiraceae bacterium]|nr:tRNA pseudouridine(55) synthase TruB [Oscillospiraceae bacterium]HPF56602.1 tRNA pseudouridine(55) synthase TruB [Clostridiales bacterium]HPK35190.1 tRNA pseudouridine(55) synthase TruB [Oscillospiraceae bacterium]HPR74993.1 tRNA pseudouridine(55) synthase TruB [Oscillospiraceae bacterium]
MDGLICVNKPRDFTSFDVVAKCRGILKERRIGHGGTLDPMATGVLPLFLGRATGAVGLCPDTEKTYLAGIQLGITTDTYDITGTTVSTCQPKNLGVADIEAVLSDFRGNIEQLPPMYSAVKVNGQRLYDIARSGREIERKPRPVTIGELICYEEDGGLFLRVTCSKGTYVRSLVHDIGQKLGCGAALSSLVRTRACGFTLEDCVTLEQLQQCRNENDETRYLRPISDVFKTLPELDITGEKLRRFVNGADIETDVPDGLYTVFHGGFIGICSVAGNIGHTKKLFCDPLEIAL